MGWKRTLGIALAVPAVVAVMAATAQAGQQPAAAASVTFHKDIEPILQRSCQKCHRQDGVAPMSLVTYEEVRPWARAIKTRTGIGPRAGVMPPLYLEKNIGIQKFKNDPSLSDEEIAKIAKWADSGAPRGNRGRHAAALKKWDDASVWAIGTPDIVVKTTDDRGQGGQPRLVGRDSARQGPGHRGSLRHGARGQGSQRRAVEWQRSRHGRWPLRVPSHDLEHARFSAKATKVPTPRSMTAARAGRSTRWVARPTSSISTRRAC